MFQKTSSIIENCLHDNSHKKDESFTTISKLQHTENIGFIDIGTNSIRLVVAKINKNYTHTLLTERKEVVRLGEGEFEKNYLTDAAMNRAIFVCKQFVKFATNFNVKKIFAVATSATRDAENKSIFLERLKIEANLDARVISGKEEARLIYLGVLSVVDLEQKNALFIDIGGGSTEIIVGDKFKPRILNSLKIGAIRLTNMFFESGTEDIVTQKTYNGIKNYVLNESVGALSKIKNEKIDVIYGSSGTIQNLAKIAHKTYSSESNHNSNKYSLVLENLKKIQKILCSLPIEKRKKISGLNPNRADIIIAGAAILETLMEELEISKIFISDKGVRDGMIADYISRIKESGANDSLSLREQSVIKLGCMCRINETHSITVTRFALNLFDSAFRLSIHSFGKWERDLLKFASYLHSIGTIISYSNYQLHSKYIILNSELLGFDQKELFIISEIVKNHRKKISKNKDALSILYEKELHDTIQLLSGFMRLAEHFDRNRTNTISNIEFIKSSNENEFHIKISCESDCLLEISAIKSDSNALEKLFCKKIIVVSSCDCNYELI